MELSHLKLMGDMLARMCLPVFSLICHEVPHNMAPFLRLLFALGTLVWTRACL